MTERVLFVDDEPRISAGLQRSLRRLRCEFEMVFAEGGLAALDQCRSRPFDVVISDARMPGMDGRLLLEQILTLSPDTVRIILSGQCSRDSAMKCVDVSHQFLNKPSDPTVIESTLRRLCAIRTLFEDSKVREAITGIQWLPCQRPVCHELEQELHSSRPSLDRVARLIGADVGVSTKLIQLVSSGFFGTPLRVRGPRFAASLLGLETIRELLTTSDAYRHSVRDRDLDQLSRCNQHSIAVATLARRIAMSLTTDKALIEDAFLAGFLHELGTLARFSCSDPLEDSTRGDLEIGGYLLALWNLSDEIVQATTFHRSPLRSGTTRFGPLAAVHLADGLLSHQHEGFGGQPSRLDREYLAQVGCTELIDQWRRTAPDMHVPEVVL